MRMVIGSKVDVCSLATVVLYIKRNTSTLPSTRSGILATIVDLCAQIIKDNGNEYVTSPEKAIQILNDLRLWQGKDNVKHSLKLPLDIDQKKVNLAHTIMEDMKVNPKYYIDEESKKKRFKELREAMEKGNDRKSTPNDS